MLTAEEATNLLKILNRATYEGLTEAAIVIALAQKLQAMANGKDVPSTD